MTATGYLRGHLMHYDGKQWRYSDTREPTVGNRRDCGHCGLADTPEGHDGCLGTLPGVANACCGHGRPEEAYVQFDGEQETIRGTAAIEVMEVTT